MSGKWLITAYGLLSLFGPHGLAEVTENNRVIAAGKLWETAKYFHPALAYRDIDWESSWIKAYPHLKAASNSEEYGRAVKGMLDVLGDPVTTPSRERLPHESANGVITTRWNTGSILIISVPDSDDWNGMTEKLRKIAEEEIPKASAVIFDLSKAISESFLYSFRMSGVEGRLSANPITLPAHRSRLHSGLVSVTATSGGYYSGFQVTDSRRIPSVAGARDIPVLFVVAERSPIPEIAVSLQLAGNGWIVSEGLITDDSLVKTTRMPLTDQIEVNLRLEELIYSDGSTGIVADATVAPGEGLKLALTMATGSAVRKHANRARVPFTASPKGELNDSGTPYPSAAYRALAALQIWSAYHFFYPYKDLMGEDWDGVLNNYLPKFESARDAREFHLAVAEMVMHVHDSHAFVNSKVLGEFYGTAPVPISVRWIENSPVVSRVIDEADAKLAGIDIGDVILAIDQQDVKVRISELASHLSASTPQALMSVVCGLLLRGPDNSTVKMRLRKASGEVRETALIRRAAYLKSWGNSRSGEIVKILPGEIGYADLARLPVSRVDEMFETLKNTKAIVFDMRGYPLGTAWAIAPRLTDARMPVAALFKRPVLMSPDTGDSPSEETVYSFSQTLPSTNKWRYKPPTVMLIDERTMSQAEHTGLFFEVANGTKFVGSPTVGANGDVTTFSVPGGIRVSMSGQNVRHADGRQLQRIGLQPDVPVVPTIAGLASGRDEVLEKAVEYINKLSN